MTIQFSLSSQSKNDSKCERSDTSRKLEKDSFCQWVFLTKDDYCNPMGGKGFR